MIFGINKLRLLILLRQDLPRHARGRHGFSGCFAFPASGPEGPTPRWEERQKLKCLFEGVFSAIIGII